MKRYLLLAALFCCTASFVFAQNKSNKGKEFWTGWGHNVLNAGTASTDSKLVIYLSADQVSNIVITVPGTSFTITDAIPAGQVRTYNIPSNVGCFITTEGVLSNKAIHIESDVPIVAYCHQYGSNSSGATMLMPVETYGYTYYSLNYTQVSNSNSPNTPYSWCFVIASEDNTKIQITPSVPTQGGKPANVTYTVNLNKGQIYNFFGRYNGTSGLNGEDLSGSKIVSVADFSGVCHPIAVFSGASRIVICSGSGGDVLQQQIFPASAWGTRYLTYPTIQANSTSTPYINFYRIAVRDPLTVVKRNGTVLTGLINNFYYEYSSVSGDYIEADKPVLVSQYMPSQNSCSGYSTSDGDPEMFYISPIEQSIKKASFYSAGLQSINQNYLCVIIPSSGLSTLKIDGSNTFDYIGFHPRNFAYRVAIKRWTQTPGGAGTQHTVESDSAFTAITYGMGGPESYGYNAGTLINNLNAVGAVQNTYGTSSTTTTCPNSPFQFSMQVAYKPTKMVWNLSAVGSNLGPVNADTTVNNPIPKDSSFLNGRKYYTYNLPREYTFSDTGTYIIPITCTAPEIDNCNNTEDVTYTVRVNFGPKADFSWAYSGCISDTVQFTGTPIPLGYSINKYRWYFDDNTQDSVINARKKFNTQGAHPTKFRVITTTGCIADTIKTVTTTPSPVATFGMSPLQSCGSASVTFTDTSSFAGSPLNVFYWDFGNGNTLTTNTNAAQTQNYPTWGTYIVKHYAGVTGGCRSDTSFRTLKVYANPTVNFSYTLGCLQDSTVQFTDNTIVPDGQTYTWSWDFGDPTSGTNNTSAAQNPTHRYTAYGTYLVTLTVTTANGCTNSITKPYTVSGFASAIQYNIINENSLCAQSLVKINNQANIAQDSIYKIDIYWDFTNNPTVFETDNTPTQGEQYTHQYLNFTTPLTKTYTIKWVVYSKGGCTSEKIKNITLNATPAVTFTTLQGKCVNATISSVANGNVTNGITGGTFTYSGNGTDATGNFNPAIAGVGVHNIQYLYTSSFSCKDSVSTSIRVFPKPVSKFGYQRDICVGDSIRFKDSATVSSGKIKNWNWDFGDATNTVRLDSNAFFKPYATANTFTVKLSVTSDSLCVSDTFLLNVTVRPRPVSTITASARLCKDTSVTFTPTSSFAGGTIQTWYYNFANTQTLTTNNSNPVTTTYLTPGNYTVKHVVNAGLGCTSDTAFLPITIYANPVADFTMSSGCLNDSTAVFNDATTVSDGQSYTWSWNFGDPSSGANNTSTNQNPTHRYTQYNSYPVTLKATTTNGCMGSIVKNFAVFGFVPTVTFTVANESQLCSSKPVAITHQTPIAIDSIYKLELYWDFANNPTAFTTDNTPTLNEVYSNSYPVFFTPASKTYTVKIKVYSKGGCTSEATKNITVYAMPQLTYNNMNGVCINSGNTSVATATLNNGVTGIGKYYGPGTDTLGNFNPVTAGVGLHNIKYVFTAAGGCKDSATAQIRVFPKPTAGFSVTNNICLSDSVYIKDTSNVITGSIKERRWDFDDGTTATKFTPAPFYKKYSSFNTFTIKLYTISDSLCVSDTVSKNVTVYPLPVIAFTPPSGVCMPSGEAKFINQSTINGGTVNSLSYVWNFGDNSPTTPVINPTHYFTASGPFDIKLIATSLQGCKDSLTTPLTAFYQQPIAKFGIIGDTLCPLKPILFSDSSSAPGSTISQWIWTFNTGDSAFTPSVTKSFGTDGLYSATLIVKNPDGCTSNPFSKSLTIYKQPVIDAGLNIYTPEGISVPMHTTINDSAAFKYKWTSSIYLNNDTLLNPICTPIFSTTYKVTATGLGNCIASDTIRVFALKQLSIPNAFSPNGDGINDRWEINFLNDYPLCKIEIFNRNGQLVYRSVGYNGPWDGTVNGNPVPVGTYYYIIELNNNGYSKLSGSITILK